jgi:hypothetical protein
VGERLREVGDVAQSGAMPSGEEIASEFERFLADRDRRRD